MIVHVEQVFPHIEHAVVFFLQPVNNGLTFAGSEEGDIIEAFHGSTSAK